MVHKRLLEAKKMPYVNITRYSQYVMWTYKAKYYSLIITVYYGLSSWGVGLAAFKQPVATDHCYVVDDEHSK